MPLHSIEQVNHFLGKVVGLHENHAFVSMNNSKKRHDGGAYRRFDTLTTLYCRPCKDRRKSRQTQQHKKKKGRKNG